MKAWIQTASGKAFDFLDPDPASICIEDIAHALAQCNRYTGHAPFAYSVARHSILVSCVTKPENALAGLLHDAAEAYLGDVSRPLKKLLPDYRDIEQRVERVIMWKFDVNVHLDDVKRADLAVFAAEARDLFPEKQRPGDWILPEPAPEGLFPGAYSHLSWRRDRNDFLDRFYELVGR